MLEVFKSFQIIQVVNLFLVSLRDRFSFLEGKLATSHTFLCICQCGKAFLRQNREKEIIILIEYLNLVNVFALM